MHAHEAVQAFHLLARLEGIIPALESAHAVAWAMRKAPTLGADQHILVNLSGRGDKDADYVAKVGPFPPAFDIVIRQTAGSGTMTLGACRLLVADKASAVGGPLGVGADATKGMLNNGAGFAEDGADVIYHRETIAYDLNHADGLQVQLGAIAGTATAIRVEAIIPRRVRA